MAEHELRALLVAAFRRMAGTRWHKRADRIARAYRVDRDIVLGHLFAAGLLMSCAGCDRTFTFEPRRPLCMTCRRRRERAAPAPCDCAVDPHAPCPYPPGTAGKVECLAARAEAGLPLWRPDDARWAA